MSIGGIWNTASEISHSIPTATSCWWRGFGTGGGELPDFSESLFRHLKFNLRKPIWVKENLINLGIDSLGEEW